MSLPRQLLRGLRALLNPRAVDREVADELQDYLEHSTAALMEAGVPCDEARRAARSEVGDRTRIRQQVRSRGWERIAANLLTDVRFAIRQLRHSPVFTTISVVILAMSIGGCSAIFSALYTVLLQSLPYARGHQVMLLWEEQSNGNPIAVAFGTFQGLARQAHSFESMAAIKPWQPVMVQAGVPKGIDGQQVTASYFHVLATVPSLGRDFTLSDDEPNAPKVTILSDRLWRTQFAASTEAIGRQLTVDGIPYTVIGVMPPSFENVLSPSVDLWAPLQYRSSLPIEGREWGHHLRVVGRLQTGMSASQAARELNLIFQGLKLRYAKGYDSSGGPSSGIAVNPVLKDVSLSVRPGLIAVFAAELLIVLLACVNVTNSLLMHGIQRKNGLSMRVATGAGPHRALRQVFIESLILAVAGGSCGIAVTQTGIEILRKIIPPEAPRVSAIGLNHITFFFLITITAILGLLLAIVPAFAIYWRHKHHEQNLQMVEPIRAIGWNHGPLLAAQVALTFTLLVGAGLLFHSIRRLSLVHLGFQPSHLLTMQIQGYQTASDSGTATQQLFAPTLMAIRRVPGVVSAGLTSQLPLSGEHEVCGIEFKRDANPVGDAGFRYTVMPGYHETMGIPLRVGRLFSEGDLVDGAPQVVIINESFAKREFKGADPIGQYVHVGFDVGHADRPWATIIGVVGDVKQESLSESYGNAVYIPTSQWTWAEKSLRMVIRTEGDAASRVPAIRIAVESVSPNQILSQIDTMDRLVERSEAELRFVLILFGSFGMVAVMLLAFGIYDVISGSVRQRIRYIDGQKVSKKVYPTTLVVAIQQGLKFVIPGLVIGACFTSAITPILAKLLFGVSLLDPITYLGSMMAILGIATLACLLPVWRASRFVPRWD